ncbi:MAG: ABC transporter permease [Candidatus Micrarchaeota archaeon]|nr:ABC transporter permease [Candidatus Micrarchaeota archaeon]MDE1848354.1 ABC transporter permease [Candidatus Micrarchaeota archaeon]MDE1864961.1 ABC transporter permease [Candidatus Micrarchaeota archaeon]
MNLKFIWSFAKFNGLSWIRDSPWSIVANVITPICLLAIVFLISKGALVAYAVVGGVIAIIASTSLTSIGQSAIFRIEFRIQDLLLSTKVHILDYVSAFAVADLVFASPGIAFFTILSIAIHLFTPFRFLTTIAVALLLTVATASIAIFVGSKIKRSIGVWSISGILSALLTLIPPTFYPYGVLPKPILYILMISPVTPAAIILQGAYGLGTVDNAMWFVLIGEVIFYLLVVRTFGTWREK